MTASLTFGRSASGVSVAIDLAMANRHGFIAGATGTGKTVTLRVLAEALSDAGVPVFLADVKGDLATLSEVGGTDERFIKRAASLGLEGYSGSSYPVQLWDVYGESGVPIRATVSDFGPVLLARLFGLNETQADVLQILFSIADDRGLPILDLKDLHAFLQFVSEHAAEFRARYGNLAPATLGTIQRRVTAFREAGGESFFGEPMFDIGHLLDRRADGRGTVHILAADRLYQSPQVYSAFLLWMLSELFEQLPEVGDLSAPKLVFFLDEAHLLFTDTPKALVEKIEQVVRLIRSKGVGVFFITQSPDDIPEDVLAQLGNRVQHALRAYTPSEQKMIRAAARSFRVEAGTDLEKELTELAVGEALVSTLQSDGVPSVAVRAKIFPPRSLLGALPDSNRNQLVAQSPYEHRYRKVIDQDSAYEMLQKRNVEPATENSSSAVPSAVWSVLGGFIKSAARAIGSQVGREIIRGVLGSSRKSRFK